MPQGDINTQMSHEVTILGKYIIFFWWIVLVKIYEKINIFCLIFFQRWTRFDEALSFFLFRKFFRLNRFRILALPILEPKERYFKVYRRYSTAEVILIVRSKNHKNLRNGQAFATTEFDLLIRDKTFFFDVLKIRFLKVLFYWLEKPLGNEPYFWEIL